MWNRQRTDRDLVDRGDIVLGRKQVQRWNLPGGWVISRTPAHPALVSEADSSPPRTSAPPAALLLTVIWPSKGGGTCSLGCWLRDVRAADGISLIRWQAAYRCRHGHTSASTPGPGRAKNVYVREDRILSLRVRHSGSGPAVLLLHGHPRTHTAGSPSPGTIAAHTSPSGCPWTILARYATCA